MWFSFVFLVFPQLVPVRCPLPPQCDVPWLRCWVECGGGRRQASSGRGRQLLLVWRHGWGAGSWSWSSPSASSPLCCWCRCCCCSVLAARGERLQKQNSKHTYIYRVRMVLLSSLLGHAHISKKASLPAVSAIQSRSALLGNADSAQIPERPFLATVIIGTEQCCWVTLKMPSRVVGHNYLIINYEWKHVLSLSSRTHTHLSIYIKEKHVSLSFNFPFV